MAEPLVCLLSVVLLVVCAIAFSVIHRLRRDFEDFRRLTAQRFDSLERTRAPESEPVAAERRLPVTPAVPVPASVATRLPDAPPPAALESAAAPVFVPNEPPAPVAVTESALVTEPPSRVSVPRVQSSTPPTASPPCASSPPVDASSDFAQPEAPPPTVAAPARARPGGAGSLEAFFGGRVLLVIGVIALLFATGYFLKLAIDEGWIDERARIALGGALGGAAIVAGYRLQSRGLSVFGQALMGLGLGAIYLCDFFASVRYGFYSQPMAFAVVAVLTAAGTVLAVRRTAPFLAWLGFAGAFFAPWLLGSDVDALEGLTTWLAVVDLGIAAALCFRAWPGLDVFGACATVGYFVAWRLRYFEPARLGASGACLAILIAVLLVTSYLPAALARRRLSPMSHMAALLAALAGYLTSFDLFFPEQRAAFAAATCGAALLVAGLALLHRARVADSKGDSESMFAGALALLVAAVPVLFRGANVAPAWSALGTAAAYAGVRSGRRSMVALGLVSVGLAAAAALLNRLALFLGHEPAVLDAGFFSALAPGVAFLVIAWLSRRGRKDASGGATFEVAEPFAVVYLAVLLFAESVVWALARTGSEGERWYLGGTLLAVLWGVCAVVYEALGARCSRKWLFTGGVLLALAACTIGGLARLVPSPRGPDTVFATPFFAALVPLAALVLATWLLRRARGADTGAADGATAQVDDARPSETLSARDVPALAAIGYFLVLVSLEIFAWGGHCELVQGLSRADARLRAQMALSVFWAVYAAALVGAGFWRRTALLRWAGIALFLVTIAKAFLVDLSNLDTIYRVGSFLALGALLLAASYLYQRGRKSG